MKAVILGGVGAMGTHTTSELVACGLFDQIVVADIDIGKLRRLAGEWKLPLEACIPLDANNAGALRAAIAGATVVVNALPKPFTLPVARACIEERARAIDLSSLSAELRALDDEARATGALYVSGCGASSGLTNMLAKHGARGLETVEAVDINFASFRAIALSPASVQGVFWEFGPGSQRAYYAEGALQPAGLFDGAREVDFAAPIGRQTVYYVPHSEVHTLPRNLHAGRVTIRGTFTPKSMRLMRSLVEFGFFEPQPVQIAGQNVARRDLIAAYLAQAPEARDEPVWGYGLHVEVTGEAGGQRLRRTLWTTWPPASQPGWSGPAAWTKCVALPLVAGTLLLARDQYAGCGVDAPEAFLPAEPFLAALAERGLQTHEQIEVL